MAENARKGNLSINSENIFPIIKKWMYSDRDIFIREMISNGCDAITKLKKLALAGEYTEPEGAGLSVPWLRIASPSCSRWMNSRRTVASDTPSISSASAIVTQPVRLSMFIR